jgi:hypothetical protein
VRSQNTQGFSAEDVASLAKMKSMLEGEAERLRAESRIAPMWRDWADLLGPASTGLTDRPMDLALDQVTPGGIGTSSPEESA